MLSARKAFAQPARVQLEEPGSRPAAHRDEVVERLDLLELRFWYVDDGFASPQQIQDRAEAWLRDQAQRYLIPLIGSLSARANRRPPGLKLSFAAGSHWAQVDGDTLRCNWRLIEHPAQLIEQVVARAIDSLPPLDLERDLFGFAFSARHPGAT